MRCGRLAGAPRLVAEEPALHARKGIFAMHAHAGRALSAGKDGAVGLCDVAPDGLRAVRAWADVREGGVVKSVAWCMRADGPLGVSAFAAGGCGGVVRVLDAREAAAASGGLRVEHAHPRDVHCVRWQPAASEGCSGAPLLLTASYDPVIRLWDPRQTRLPVAELRGHVAPALARQQRIHQPVFCGAGGEAICTSGEGSESLSIYCARTFAPLSRGHVGWEPSTLASAAAGASGGGGGCVAVAHGRTITLLEVGTVR